MRPEAVFQSIGPLPYMTLRSATLFYDFILANRLSECLELGCFHGVSTAYIAGAIQDLGTGALTTIDLATAANRDPNVEQVLVRIGLRSLVEVIFEPRSYNWRLMKLLEEGREECFDFCFIDGGHNWYDTGLAFCLLERLLKPGGWVVFDDLNFTYRTSSLKDTPRVRKMPEEEQIARQIERVFELLVETNPHFGSFRRIDKFGFARKETSLWSAGDKRRIREDIVISRVLERARRDGAFRQLLLDSPSEAISGLLGSSCVGLLNVRFAETTCLAPVPSEVNDDGSKTVFIEPATY